MGGAATNVLPGCVTILLRCGGKRRQARSAGKARDKSRRRRFTRLQFAYVDGSVRLADRYDDSIVTVSVFDRQLGRARDCCLNAARVASKDRMYRTRSESVLFRKDCGVLFSEAVKRLTAEKAVDQPKDCSAGI
jgi:hypothetical protein